MPKKFSSNIPLYIGKYSLVNDIFIQFNILSVNPAKLSNTQTILRQLRTNYWSVFDHFVWLTLKGLSLIVGLTVVLKVALYKSNCS